jgi:hypothetical protein
MLRRTTLSLFAVALAGAVSVYACGGSSSDDTSKSDGGAGTTGKPDPEDPGARPPDAPTGPAAAGATPTVIALNKLLLGDTDADGTANASAWRTLGYNIDGLISTKNGTNHCKPQTGASPSSVKTDGENGIDNSFGSNLVPIISSLASNPSDTISQSLQDGSFTIMLKLDKLEDAANQTGIAAGLYGGAKFDAGLDCTATPTETNCSPPKWDGTDQWPVLPELLNGGNVDDPKVKFPQSYVADGTWVSGSQGTLNLSVSIQGFSLTLNIEKAVITMKIAGAGATAKATGGVIAGVIPTEQLISELKKVAGGFDVSLCEGATFESIAQEIRQASDIMQDGTNGDPNQTCDGISVGLGFEGLAVNIGAVADAATAPADPCADAGG